MEFLKELVGVWFGIFFLLTALGAFAMSLYVVVVFFTPLLARFEEWSQVFWKKK